MSACTNPDKTLKMELISRIQEEKGRKRLKHQTSQALASLRLSSSVPFPDTNSISSTNQSFIVDYSKKKVVIDKLLNKGLLSAGVQLSVLRNKHFCESLTKISEFGCRYIPPSNETVRTKIALSVKNDVDEAIKVRLAQWFPTGAQTPPWGAFAASGGGGGGALKRKGAVWGALRR